MQRHFFLVVLTLLMACKIVEPTSSESFLVFNDKELPFAMINKIHANVWKIAYSFDKKCKELGFGEQKIKKELEDSMEEAIKIWLHPLKDEVPDNKKIVDNFKFEEVSFSDGNFKRHLKSIRFKREELKKNEFMAYPHDFFILLGCSPYDDQNEEQRPYAEVSADLLTINRPVIFFFTGAYSYKIFGDFFLTSKKRFQSSILIHEMGHVIGLADTYHSQPQTQASVMNTGTLAFDKQGLTIREDDLLGIVWLYHYAITKQKNTDSGKVERQRLPIKGIYNRWQQRNADRRKAGKRHLVKKDLRENKCPAGYYYHEEEMYGRVMGVGCAPLYPAIHSVKGGFFKCEKALMGSWKEKFVNQQDDLGNTALHYAVLQEKLHGADMCKELLKCKAKLTLKNNDGKLAKDLAMEGSKCF